MRSGSCNSFPRYQGICSQFGLGISLAYHIVDACKDRVRRAVALLMAEIDSTIRQKHGLVRRTESDRISTHVAIDMNSSGHQSQESDQRPGQVAWYPVIEQETLR
jgi:hypothetical protein